MTIFHILITVLSILILVDSFMMKLLIENCLKRCKEIENRVHVLESKPFTKESPGFFDVNADE